MKMHRPHLAGNPEGTAAPLPAKKAGRKRKAALWATLVWKRRTELGVSGIEAANIHLTAVLWFEIAKPAYQSGEMIQPIFFLKMEMGEYRGGGESWGMWSVQPHLGKALQALLSGIDHRVPFPNPADILAGGDRQNKWGCLSAALAIPSKKHDSSLRRYLA